MLSMSKLPRSHASWPPVHPPSSRKPVSPREISESLRTRHPAWPTDGRPLPCTGCHRPDMIFSGVA